VIGSTFARAIVSMLVLALVSGVAAVGAQSPSRGIGLDSSKSNRAATVWAVGDGNAYTDGQRMERLVEAGKPDRFLYLGDVYEHGTPSDFESNFRSSYGRIAKWTAPTPGNHEWPLHAQGYDVFWKDVLKKPIPPYYKFTIAGWDILSLNSEAPHDEASPQVKWLRSKLTRRGTCRLAFWHRPRYGEDLLEGGDQPDVQPFWDALRRKAVIVLNGHNHNMQRFPPIEGITEFVVGSGGHGHHPLSTTRRRYVFANDQLYGALRLTLKPGQAKYRYVAVGGQTLDAGSIKCKRFRAKKKKRKRS
jgi:hypothetical protein